MLAATTALKKLGLNALYFTGTHHLMARRTRGVGAVLMLHHVRPDRGGDFAPNAHLEATPEFLERVIGRVRQLDIDIVDLSEAAGRLKTPGSRRFCAITFDDGYRDNLEYAYPVLKAAGAPFTVFVATGLVDRTADLWWVVLEHIVERQTTLAVALDGQITYLACRTTAEKYATYNQLIGWLLAMDEDRQREVVRELAWRYGVDPGGVLDEEMMTWAELSRLAADPLVTIGAHTIGHYALAKLPLGRARSEVRDSARVLEAGLGAKPRHFAYPYGASFAAGEREFRLVSELGFETGVTTRPGVLFPRHASTMTALPRVSINGHYQAIRYLDLFLSGAAYALYGLVGRREDRAKPPNVTAVASSG